VKKEGIKMFRELISNGANERPALNGAYVGRFLGVVERQRATFETRNDPEPVYEDVFVFEFEVDDEELPYPLRVAKWVRKPQRLAHPGRSGKTTNLYKVLASLYGVAQMTDEQLLNAEEFVRSAVGREYQLTIETRPSGWYEIIHIAPVRRSRRQQKEVVDVDETIPF
jgi:hypothetical protein